MVILFVLETFFQPLETLDVMSRSDDCKNDSYNPMKMSPERTFAVNKSQQNYSGKDFDYHCYCQDYCHPTPFGITFQEGLEPSDMLFDMEISQYQEGDCTHNVNDRPDYP